MDDTKTLAQLVEEVKEKKYVALDTAARISGHSVDYLSRLTKGNRIEYRLRQDGGLALELDSLLRETQTILVSYEGIPFVEKDSLTDPHIALARVEAALSPVPPLPPRTNQIIDENEAEGLMFVGRSVISNDDRSPLPPPTSSFSAPPPPPALRKVTPSVPLPLPPTLQKPTPVPATPITVGVPVVPVSLAEHPHPLPVHVPISIYRPIETSPDPTPHYDPAPLFPPLNARSQEESTSALSDHVDEFVEPTEVEREEALLRKAVRAPRVTNATRVASADTVGVFTEAQTTPFFPKERNAESLLPSTDHLLLPQALRALLFFGILTGIGVAAISVSLFQIETKTIFDRDGAGSRSVAGVSAALPDQLVLPQEKDGGSDRLPFSDDIIVEGSSGGAMIVRPVFRNGPGAPVEVATTSFPQKVD